MVKAPPAHQVRPLAMVCLLLLASITVLPSTHAESLPFMTPKTVADVASQGQCLRSTVYDGQAYFLMSESCSPVKPSPTALWKYDLTTQDLVKISNLPGGMAAGTMAGVNGSLYIFGSTLMGQDKAHNMRYSPATGILETLDSWPINCHPGRDAFVVGEKLVFASSCAWSCRMVEYDTRTDSWRFLNSSLPGEAGQLARYGVGWDGEIAHIFTHNKDTQRTEIYKLDYANDRLTGPHVLESPAPYTSHMFVPFNQTHGVVTESGQDFPYLTTYNYFEYETGDLTPFAKAPKAKTPDYHDEGSFYFANYGTRTLECVAPVGDCTYREAKLPPEQPEPKPEPTLDPTPNPQPPQPPEPEPEPRYLDPILPHERVYDASIGPEGERAFRCSAGPVLRDETGAIVGCLLDEALPLSDRLDTDEDGIIDHDDSCKFIYNPLQEDHDGDGLGDACDDDYQSSTLTLLGCATSHQGCAPVSSCAQACEPSRPTICDVLPSHSKCASFAAPNQDCSNTTCTVWDRLVSWFKAAPRTCMEDCGEDPCTTNCSTALNSMPPNTASVAGGNMNSTLTALALVMLGGAALVASRKRKFGFLGLGLLSRTNRASHPTRELILETIHDQPGTHALELSRTLDVPRTTLRHHINVLARTQEIRLEKQGKYTCCFPIQSEALQPPVARTELAKDLAKMVQNRPGIQASEASRKLGVTYGAVAYHFRQMADAGLMQLASRPLAAFPTMQDSSPLGTCHQPRGLPPGSSSAEA